MTAKRKNRLRVTGGSCRGRLVQFADNEQLRPTTERSREAIFSILENLGALSGKTGLDLFAGSGILGIEALSRGARKIHFVESSRKSALSIEENLKSLSFQAQGRVWSRSIQSFFQSATIEQPFDFIVADPPYDYVFGEQQLLPLFQNGLCANRLHLLLERRKLAKSQADDSSRYILGTPSSSAEENSVFGSYQISSRQIRAYGDSEFEFVELRKKATG